MKKVCSPDGRVVAQPGGIRTWPSPFPWKQRMETCSLLHKYSKCYCGGRAYGISLRLQEKEENYRGTLPLGKLSYTCTGNWMQKFLQARLLKKWRGYKTDLSTATRYGHSSCKGSHFNTNLLPQITFVSSHKIEVSKDLQEGNFLPSCFNSFIPSLNFVRRGWNLHYIGRMHH